MGWEAWWEHMTKMWPIVLMSVKSAMSKKTCRKFQLSDENGFSICTPPINSFLILWNACTMYYLAGRHSGKNECLFSITRSTFDWGFLSKHTNVLYLLLHKMVALYWICVVVFWGLEFEFHQNPVLQIVIHCKFSSPILSLFQPQLLSIWVGALCFRLLPKLFWYLEAFHY